MRMLGTWLITTPPTTISLNAYQACMTKHMVQPACVQVTHGKDADGIHAITILVAAMTCHGRDADGILMMGMTCNYHPSCSDDMHLLDVPRCTRPRRLISGSAHAQTRNTEESFLHNAPGETRAGPPLQALVDICKHEQVIVWAHLVQVVGENAGLQSILGVVHPARPHTTLLACRGEQIPPFDNMDNLIQRHYLFT